MRYTECRLARISDEMLEEIDEDTVAFRPNYDGTKTEPVVLPSRLPNLLVNGATGIAVGMATSIPPHNLAEVCTALVKLLDNPDLSSRAAVPLREGPGLPDRRPGAQLARRAEGDLQDRIGSIRLRGTWEEGPATPRARKTIYITSIPYTVNKSQLVERIAEVVVARKLPPLVDVKDVSADDVRIALEIKRDADEKMVLAYLFKHTPLQTNFIVNLTCLIPTENPEVCRPERLDLKSMLWHFLHFRLDVVTRRLEHELEALSKRIHVLEGFDKVFDALDEIIKLIRKSDGKADAARQIIKRFGLDEEQTDAILELKLYRLARLEILVIRKELEEKQKRVRQIGALLRDEEARWKLVRDEIVALQQKYGNPKTDPRRTMLERRGRGGRVHRRRLHRRRGQRRHRVARRVGEAAEGGPRPRRPRACGRATRCWRCCRAARGRPWSFFTNFGVAYTCRIIDVPASTGYGEPIQRLFKFRDGEKVVSAFSLDPAGDEPGSPAAKEGRGAADARAGGDDRRLQPALRPRVVRRAEHARGAPLRAAGGRGRGRRRVAIVHGDETMIAVTEQARAMLCKVEEVNFLSGPGQAA